MLTGCGQTGTMLSHAIVHYVFRIRWDLIWSSEVLVLQYKQTSILLYVAEIKKIRCRLNLYVVA